MPSQNFSNTLNVYKVFENHKLTWHSIPGKVNEPSKVDSSVSGSVASLKHDSAYKKIDNIMSDTHISYNH
jgi:hypothetical protein